MMMITCSQIPLLVHVIFVLNDFMKKLKWENCCFNSCGSLWFNQFTLPFEFDCMWVL